MSASFDANPFGSVQFSVKSPLSGFPPVQQQATGYVPPLVIKPVYVKGNISLPQQQIPHPDGMQLLANALGIPSLVSFLSGSKKTTSTGSFTLNGSSSLHEASWDSEAIDPETGETIQMKALRRLPGFYEEPDNPFDRSLDILS